MAGFADDPGIVPAARQHEGDVGVGQQMDLEGRPPRRDMVLLGADREDRRAQVGQRNRSAADPEASFGQVIVQEQLAQE